MNKSENNTSDPLLVRMANKLLHDQQELDELALQFALGKAEAAERFEALKHNVHHAIRDFKHRLTIEGKHGREVTQQMLDRLQDLETTLAGGLASTKEKFQEQKAIILKKMEAVTKAIREDGMHKTADLYATVAEKARLKLDLFEKKFSEKKLEISDEFKEEMTHARAKIDQLIEKSKDVKEDVAERLDEFNDEVRIAYDHLKKVFKAL